MSSITATLTNTGTADLVVGTIAIEADSGFALANDEASGQTIAPAGSKTFDIVFTPGFLGTYDGVVVIPTNDQESPLVVPLSGTGIAAAAPAITVDPPTTWDAGSVDIDGGTAARVFSVGNPGTADLHVGTVAKTGSDFTKSSDSASGATITPGGSRSFTITFDPSTTGAKTGSVTVPSDAGPDVVVALSGTGTEEAPQPYEASRLYLTREPTTVEEQPWTDWFVDMLTEDETSYLLSPTKQGPGTAVESINRAGSSGRRVGFHPHVSPPLAAQDLRGVTFHAMALVGRASGLGSNVTGVAWFGRLRSGTLTAIGGCQPSSAAGAWPANPDRANRRLPGGGTYVFAIPSVSAAVLSEGDRLVVILGARIFTTSTGNVSIVVGGGSGATNVATSQDTDTDQSHAPWVDFGSPILVMP